MSTIVYTLEGGEPISNFETLGAVDTVTFTVPNGKKWRLISGYAERDVNATFDMRIEDADGNIIFAITQVAAGVTNLTIPTDLADVEDRAFLERRLMLGGGWEVIFTWGVAQITPEVSLWVVET